MQCNYEKIFYQFVPCKPLQPCFDLGDYDPCESGDDITEKDLAIFLKEEKGKLEETKDELQGEYDGIRKVRSVLKNEKFFDEGELEEKVVNNEPVKNKGSIESKDETTRGGHTAKKRICKKPIKNPFFTNRLKFSSQLPPPPPAPPPQFFPLVETDSKGKIICPRRKKRCKSKTDVKGRKEKDFERKAKGEGSKNDEGKSKDEPRRYDQWKRGQGGEDESLVGRDDEEKSEGENASGRTENDLSDLEQHTRAEKVEEGKTESRQNGKDKRKCKKAFQRPPCRKKLSDISLMLQPRRIPLLQKDLPLSSPKEIPEVERQILMSCKNTCQVDCRKKKCKKKY